MFTNGWRVAFFEPRKADVSLSALSESLAGLDSVLKVALKTACRFTGLNAVSTEILVDGVEISSYKDSVILRFLIGDEEQVEAFIETTRAKLGMDKLSWKTMMSALIAGSVLYGAYKFFIEDDAVEVREGDIMHVEINNSFNSIGSELNMSGDEVKGILEAALNKSDKEALKRGVVKVLKPNGEAVSGSVIIDGNEKLCIPKSVVDRVPLKYEKRDEEEPWEEVKGVDVTIRAIDLDNNERGWYAIIPDLSLNRVKMILADGVDARTLPVGTYFKGDVVVIFKKGRKDKVPKEYQLLRKQR